jgi:hypothetical protein
VTATPPSDADPLVRLARESGRTLAELGVDSDDLAWIAAHAATIASLRVPSRPRGPGAGLVAALYRLARRAARTAR